MHRSLFRRALPLLLLLVGCSDDPLEPDPGNGTGTGGSPALDALVSYNVQSNDACGKIDFRTGRVMARSTYATVVADTANPAGGFSRDDYTRFARDFDTHVYPVITGYFGEPKDINKDGRIIIFFTRAVNELTPAGSKNSYVGGFFFSRDLFPKKGTPQLQGCAGSNEKNMFYLMVPDPSGVVNNNSYARDDIYQIGLATIAHEFQHLINASRRLFINNADSFEEVWLNEGLSHIAEELMFYHFSGLSPRMSLDESRIRSSQTIVEAFNQNAAMNFGRLNTFYQAPELNSPYGDSATIGERGAIWQLLRHLADRSKVDEAQLWHRLLNSKTSGFANLQQVLGVDPLPLVRDWSVAAYTSNHISTTDSVRFQLSSWNYRSILRALKRPEPRATSLTDRTPQGVTLVGGGSTYLAFSVPIGPGEVRLTTGTAPASARGCPAGSALKLAVGQVHTPDRGDVDGLCLDRGDYLLVPINLSDVAASTLTFNVTGFGITPPVTNTALPVVAGLSRMEIPRPPATFDGARRDHVLEARVRRLEVEALSPRLGAPGRRLRPNRSLQPQSTAQTAMVPGLEQLYLSIVRTR